VDLGHFFSFLILYTVGRTPWTGDQPVARPLPAHRHPWLKWASTHDPSAQAGEDGSCLRRISTTGEVDRLESACLLIHQQQSHYVE
jgi:hypothetical protein